MVLRGVVVCLWLAAPSAVRAQDGGASSTGVINGKGTDTSGTVLPGATITVASPLMMGEQSDATNEQGIYRFPAVPPGTYAVT